MTTTELPTTVTVEQVLTITPKRLKERRNFIAWMKRQPGERRLAQGLCARRVKGDDKHHDGTECCACIMVEYVLDHCHLGFNVYARATVWGNIEIRHNHGGEERIFSYNQPWIKEVIRVFDNACAAEDFKSFESRTFDNFRRVFKEQGLIS